MSNVIHIKKREDDVDVHNAIEWLAKRLSYNYDALCMVVDENGIKAFLIASVIKELDDKISQM